MSKSDWQYYVETMRLRYGDAAPYTQDAYGEAEIAAPNPHDVPACPTPYAPNAPNAPYRSKKDPYPGAVIIAQIEMNRDRKAVIRQAVKPVPAIPEPVKKKIEEWRAKEAARLRAYRLRKKLARTN